MAKAPSREYLLEIPLDASAIEDFKPDQTVKVLVADQSGPIKSAVAEFDKDGHATAKLSLAARPGQVRVHVGPVDASDEELTGLQTIVVDVPLRQWADRPALKLPPIRISPYYWHWWRVWCRQFVIRGRVVCANGQPVPGAKVCAYDVDWWFWWISKQLVACDTTDINGAFEIKFRWCCGWWPWWWWRNRFWQLEPLLVERVLPVLQRDPSLAALIRPKPQPALADFAELLGAEGAHLTARRDLDPTVLPQLGEQLLYRLPRDLELERLRIWPWWPWRPGWADCNPDIIFKVTQDCAGKDGSDVIVAETLFNTRWDTPTTLDNVILLAGDNACCIPPVNDCPGGDCLALTAACGSTVDNIGGNITAPAAPLGYQNPGVGSVFSDRPFAGAIQISGTADCMDDVDYYEFEWATAPAGLWHVMPAAANGAFARTYIQFTPLGFHGVTFAPALISGRNVFETLQHYETTHPGAWGIDRIWIGARDVLINWLTENNFADGLYYLRVRGWNVDAGGNLVDQRVLKVCNSDDDAFIVLRVDNRVLTSGPNDLHGNPCTAVHACTDEPDTAIVSVEIHRGGNVIDIAGCASETLQEGDSMVIDFVAHDPDGHLASYGLAVHYDVNLATPLIPLGTLVPGPAWSGVPSAAQVGPNYLAALGQGAGRPTWAGGVMRLTLTGTGLKTAFPYTCCYQLRLDAHKRTIVNCNDTHRNTSETSFTIIV